MNRQPILLLDDITVHIDGALLFSGLSMALNPGDKVTLAGPSGCGKSTLLRCIVGFVPCEGAVRVAGERLTATSVWRLRRRIAYVAQEPDLGEGLVRDALERPFAYRANRELNFEQGTVDELFDRFLLPRALQGKALSSISGGEKQRVALVSALLLQRPLLLLDEAASALDARAKKEVREYLCSRADLTILSVSHDVRDFRLTDHVVEMKPPEEGPSQ